MKVTRPLKLHKEFTRENSGNFSIIAAVSLPVTLLALFGALDYSNFVRSQQQLDAAAAAAALSAINEAQIAFSKKEENMDLNALIVQRATDIFNQRIPNISDTQVSNIRVIPSVENNVLGVDVSYSAQVGSFARGILGIDYYKIRSKRRAKAAVRSYVNFNFVFDVSASMGIGATPADQQLLFDTINCAFACHINAPRGSSSYDRARAAGGTMRIDVARDAAKNAVDIISQNAETSDHMTVGLSIFDNRLIEISNWQDPGAASYTLLKDKIETDVALTMTHGGTDIAGAVSELATSLPGSGSGRTPDDRIQYIIVLTDGIEHDAMWNPGDDMETRNRRRGWDMSTTQTPTNPRVQNSYQTMYTLSTTACIGAHQKDIGVFFINTEYLIPDTNIQGHGANGDWRLQRIESNLLSSAQFNMEMCAGNPSKVIKTITPEEINSAFKEIIGDLSSPLKLY